jgi:predicted O-methyltransferase YrrM
MEVGPMTSIIEEIYKSQVVFDARGNPHPLIDHVDEAEGAFLSSFIRDRIDIAETLEVGFAYGISALHITTATLGRAGAKHVAIDPFQRTDYKGIGIANLERAGIKSFELIEEFSELALPALLRERPQSFDLVFIDGWHTFDHTLLDMFYGNRLLRVGGYLIVDDCNMPSVAKAVDYVSKYPAYRIIGQSPLPGNRRLASHVLRSIPRRAAGMLPRQIYDQQYAQRMFPTMVALQKVAEDERRWNWFASF